MKTTATQNGMIKKLFSFLTLILVFFLSANAQNGDIKGNVVDETNAGAVAATVTLYSADKAVASQTPDAQGDYFFKEVTPGTYDIKITQSTYKAKKIIGITVIAFKTFYVQNTKLVEDPTMLGQIDVIPAEKSMAQETMSTGKSIDEMEFKEFAGEKGDLVGMISIMTPGITPTADGKDMYVRGARKGTTQYIIDGEKVIGSYDVPSGSVQNVTVYTGGIPAQFGDLTGGLVNVSTKSYFSCAAEKRNWYKEYYEQKEKEAAEKQQQEEDAKDQNQGNKDEQK